MCPRLSPDRDLTVQDMFEAVGNLAVRATMTEAELEILERVACPSAGACGGQFTANTMACVSEAIGLALPNSSGAPAPYESRDEYGHRLRRAAVMHLVEQQHPRPRHLSPARRFENAARDRGLHGRIDQRGAAPAGHGA